MAMRMNDTTGVDFIKISAGEKRELAISNFVHNDANMNAAGIAAIIPMKILKNESAVNRQNSESLISSKSLDAVSIGVGSIKGLATAIAAPCQISIQKISAEKVSENFLILLIYPKIPSSGIAPPIEEGSCAKSAPQNSFSAVFISLPTR